MIKVRATAGKPALSADTHRALKDERKEIYICIYINIRV